MTTGRRRRRRIRATCAAMVAPVPHARWPAGARIAVQFVLNYEEGGENNVLHGDATSETFLSELITAQAYENRHMTMESMYEYGSRVGVWRILREFERRRLPLTVFGVVSALQRYPELVAAFLENGYEIANHGLRWIHHQHMPEATERRHIGVGRSTAARAHAGRVAAGLVHRPRQPQHAPPGGRAGRLRLRQRLLRRRPAAVDARHEERRHHRAAFGGAVLARHQRHALRCRCRASTPATTSSPICATASTRCTPRAKKSRG